MQYFLGAILQCLGIYRMEMLEIGTFLQNLEFVSRNVINSMCLLMSRLMAFQDLCIYQNLMYSEELHADCYDVHTLERILGIFCYVRFYLG